MTHGKRGEANGEGKKEKSTFFLPSQSHKSYGKSSSPVVFACVRDYARRARDDGDRAARDDGDYP